MSFNKEQVRVGIIGAGIAGISAAIALKRKLGFENFVIFEQGSDIGGTWRDNTYPGCGSDVGGHWYSLSTDLNPYWSAYYIEQAEIFAYWAGLVDKYGLAPHVSLNTRVTAAHWDNTAQVYHLTLTDPRTGETRTESAEVLMSAMGGFVSPLYPADIPGTEAFAGVAFHSARWRHDVELKGKRVGVIGNGCSAAQFLPLISKDPSVEVVNFCRTPSWFVPRGNFKYPSWVKWILANVPFAMRSYRNFIAMRHDITYLGFRNDNKRIQAAVRNNMTKYIKHKAPADQLDKLIPGYPPGCKRIIVDPGYLKALNRPNVHLNWDGIDAIVTEGIRTKAGETIPLDVIIFGTGFELLNSTNLNVTGQSGMLLSQYFESQGGPTAYLGTTIPGFPNFYMLLGPNTATGHASIVFTEELQIDYALKMIKPVIDRAAQSFEVRADACDAYNKKIQQRFVGTVFTTCASYYQGATGKGKNIAIFPGPLTVYWWWMRTPKWENYKAVGARRWEASRRAQGVKRVLYGVFMVAFALGLFSARSRGLLSSIWEKAGAGLAMYVL